LTPSGKQYHPCLQQQQQQQQRRQLDQIKHVISCSKMTMTMLLMTMTRRHQMTMMTMMTTGKPLAGVWQLKIDATLSREQVQQQQLAALLQLVTVAGRALHLSC
jgi:hypothetical protein